MNTQANMNGAESADLRHLVLGFLKEHRSASITEIAAYVQTTYQGARKQVAQLERDGLVSGVAQRGTGTIGRPTVFYSLTLAGEHLFPKSYDDLASTLIGTMDALLGDQVVMHVLEAITDARVARVEAHLKGLPFAERLEKLRDLYMPNDPYTEIVDEGGPVLIERNCPFLNVAQRHPELCSTSVAMLRRLLGYEVVREERFQDGDRRCAFRVLLDRPIERGDDAFRLEPEKGKGREE